MGQMSGGTITPHTGGSFNHGAANLQPVNGKLYVPQPFAPLNSASVDIFEAEIKRILGADVKFVDCWEMYHAFMGEVHCGTNVKRLPVADWWKKQPK